MLKAAAGVACPQMVYNTEKDGMEGESSGRAVECARLP